MASLNKVNKEQLIFGSLAIIGIVSFFFGTAQLKKNLWLNPDDTNSAARSAGRNVAPADITTFSDVRQQQQDTDGDGLSDYAELNAYATSPYLADSDGDDISDADEIRNGTDPNCPAGRDCGTPRTSGASGSDTGTNESAELRRILIESGFPADEINAMTDTDIRAFYQQIFAEFGENQTIQQAPPQENTPPQITADQIREQLRAQGIPEEELNKATDQELLELFNQAQAAEQAGL